MQVPSVVAAFIAAHIRSPEELQPDELRDAVRIVPDAYHANPVAVINAPPTPRVAASATSPTLSGFAKLGLSSPTDRTRPYIYAIRLVAFLLIIGGMIEKNRGR